LVGSVVEVGEEEGRRSDPAREGCWEGKPPAGLPPYMPAYVLVIDGWMDQSGSWGRKLFTRDRSPFGVATVIRLTMTMML
jgi:hypothetical protein